MKAREEVASEMTRRLLSISKPDKSVKKNLSEVKYSPIDEPSPRMIESVQTDRCR